MPLERYDIQTDVFVRLRDVLEALQSCQIEARRLSHCSLEEMYLMMESGVNSIERFYSGVHR